MTKLRKQKRKSSKVGIIVPSNVGMAPYLKYYTDILEKKGIETVTISWNRFGINEDADYIFDYRTENYDRKRVLVGHIRFAKFCKRMLKKEKVGKLIVFTMAPAFFLGLGFLNSYKDRLIIDVRDDTPFRERFPKLFTLITNKAYAVVVSSPLYSNWFNRETVLCHNVDMSMLNQYKDTSVPVPSLEKIRVVFAGSMREAKINIQVVDVLKNDNHFSMTFIGRENAGIKEIQKHVIEHGISNVFFEGAYKKEDIIEIYKGKADLVNAFRERSLINTNALPNKMYDAVVSGIPIVIFRHNKAMSTYVENYSLGLALEEDMTTLKNDIFEKMKKFDYASFMSGRQSFLEKVETDMKYFELKVLDFIEI